MRVCARRIKAKRDLVESGSRQALNTNVLKSFGASWDRSNA